MKVTYRIPTKDQYAFVEVVHEEDVLELEEAKIREIYDALTNTFKDGPGLSQSKWNAWLDGYLAGKPGSVEEWEQMDARQKDIINEVKKSLKRTN